MAHELKQDSKMTEPALTEAESPITLEHVLHMAEAHFNESVRDQITFDNPGWYRAANNLINGDDSEIIEAVREGIIESAERKGLPKDMAEVMTDHICDLIKKRVFELSGPLLIRYLDRDTLEELAKRAPTADAEMQTRITEFLGTESNLIATATTRAGIHVFNKQALELLATIEATEYDPRITFRTPDQEYTFDASDPATMLEQIGDTDKMIVRCRESYRKPTEISVMMSTPPPPRLKITPSKLPGLTVGDVVARIPRHWEGEGFETIRQYFGLTISPHITVEFTN